METLFAFGNEEVAPTFIGDNAPRPSWSGKSRGGWRLAKRPIRRTGGVRILVGRYRR